MPLTPEDVRNKRFTPVRLREGYDMGEVDQFLDEVEAELERLTTENNDLRSKVAAAASGEPTKSVETPAPVPTPTPAPVPVVETPKPVEPVAPPKPSEQLKVTTIGDASSAAARLLEIATRNADELVADAKDQADKILSESRTKSERIENESRGKADRVESDARTRAQKLDSETNERRQQLIGDLEKDRDELGREVEHLRSFEREYRSRLKSYFTTQLGQLDGEETVGDNLSGEQLEHTPKRLKTLLGEDEKPNNG